MIRWENSDEYLTPEIICCCFFFGGGFLAFITSFQNPNNYSLLRLCLLLFNDSLFCRLDLVAHVSYIVILLFINAFLTGLFTKYRNLIDVSPHLFFQQICLLVVLQFIIL